MVAAEDLVEVPMEEASAEDAVEAASAAVVPVAALVVDGPQVDLAGILTWAEVSMAPIWAAVGITDPVITEVVDAAAGSWVCWPFLCSSFLC